MKNEGFFVCNMSLVLQASVNEGPDAALQD